MNKKTMNFYSYKLLGLLSLTLLSQPASADLFKCNACPAGYKCDGNTQYACPAGTYSHAGAASCTNCPAGQYQDKTAQSSCKSCPAGTVNSYDATYCYCQSKIESCTYSYKDYSCYTDSKCIDDCKKYSINKTDSYCNSECYKCKYVTVKKSGSRTVYMKYDYNNSKCVEDHKSSCS